jgi:hypothetical protein
MRGRSGLIGVLACLGVLAAGCGGGDDDSTSSEPSAPPPTSPVAPSTAAPTPAPTSMAATTTVAFPTEGLIAEIEVLGGPDWLEADEHGVWAKLDNGGLVLIAPATNAIVDTVDVDVGGELCQGLGAGDGSIWACSGTGVARVDAGHPEVLSVLPVNKAYNQGDIGVAEGQLWVLQGDGSTLMGYLTDTQDEWSRFPLPVRGTDLGVGEAGLWVLSSVDGAVVHVDMGSGLASDPVALTGPLDIAVDDEVWVATASETVRIDAAGAIDLRVPVGIGGSGSIVLTPGEVWIRNLDPLLTRVDRMTGEIIGTYTADVTSGGDSVYAFGSVWTSAADDATIFRFAAPD